MHNVTIHAHRALTETHGESASVQLNLQSLIRETFWVKMLLFCPEMNESLENLPEGGNLPFVRWENPLVFAIGGGQFLKGLGTEASKFPEI